MDLLACLAAVLAPVTGAGIGALESALAAVAPEGSRAGVDGAVATKIVRTGKEERAAWALECLWRRCALLEGGSEL